VFGKDCVVESLGQDRYGRTIGRVTVDSASVNVAMLEAGMAWHFTKYDQRADLAEREAKARKARTGLWADQSAIPPWHWRKMPKAERDGVRQGAPSGALK
jgi:endonuclease YncB( thermonuclease family)